MTNRSPERQAKEQHQRSSSPSASSVTDSPDAIQLERQPSTPGKIQSTPQSDESFRSSGKDSSPVKRVEHVYPIRSIFDLAGSKLEGGFQSRRASADATAISNTSLKHFTRQMSNSQEHVPAYDVVVAPEESMVPEDSMQYPTTKRFQYVETHEGHMIVTEHQDGRETVACEDEPIQMPGAIQGFGALIVLLQDEKGNLTVRQASENTQEILGLTPSYLFSLKSFTDVLQRDDAETLQDQIMFIQDQNQSTDRNESKDDGADVFAITGYGKDDSVTWSCWCAIHISYVNDVELIILEFEAQQDAKFPLINAMEVPSSPPPSKDLQSDQLNESEYLESIMSISKPLRLFGGRNSGQRRLAQSYQSMDHFRVLTQINDQLSRAPDLKTCLRIAVGMVKEITGFDRVMVYQFDEDWNGQVVAELVDRASSDKLYRGLHFPASDIPAQARDLYRINHVRLLYDRTQPTARLIGRTADDLKTPLNMTHCFLRAMSPIHLKYLENMDVRSSMSISIVAFDQLWGLISCHCNSLQRMRVSFVIRRMCRLLGEAVSTNIERLSLSQRLHARKLINTDSTMRNPGGFIVTKADDLLTLFDAEMGILSIADEGKIMGTTTNSQEAMVILQFLRASRFTTIRASVDIKRDFADIDFGLQLTHIAGFLLVPLVRDGRDFIVFFRSGQLKQKHWAGNPYEKLLADNVGGNTLMPRQSFKVWSETVIGKCTDWTEEHLETAAVLHLVYGKFIEVWREKEDAVQSTRLATLLINNASHEVRTPLNAVVNYLEIALESQLDSETRDNLIKSHAASKSLIYVINDLLDLTRTESGNPLLKNDVFNLIDIMKEALAMFEHDSHRNRLEITFKTDEAFPRYVLGDAVRVRQVLSNVISNAISHTEKGSVQIIGKTLGDADGQITIEISIRDTGCGISPRTLDKIFQHFEQIDGMEKREEGAGLGLAIVARVVRNMNGQLRAESTEGEGSIFTFQFAFASPTAHQLSKYLSEESLNQRYFSPIRRRSISNEGTQSHSFPVRSPRSSISSPRRSEELHRTRSFDSQSSSRSELDQLVDAMSSQPFSDRSHSNASHEGGRIQGTVSGGSSGYRNSGGSYSVTSGHSPGTYAIQSTSPIRPIKIDADQVDVPAANDYVTERRLRRSSLTSSHSSNTISFDTRTSVSQADYGQSLGTNSSSDSTTISVLPISAPNLHFRILVAEDDLVNRMICKKRLENDGHEVHFANNGSEAYETFVESPQCDVILMDLQVRTSAVDSPADQSQMPLCDGRTATRKIRMYESNHSNIISRRIPILAVSASLLESDKTNLVEAGFDGWVLKPINFTRLHELLGGASDTTLRDQFRYQRHSTVWERGGWF